MDMAPWEIFVRGTVLHAFVHDYEHWLWPLLQSLHYLGGSLLIGTVGLFDLRVLGMARGIAPGALHRLVPWGVGGFLFNLCLGILFFSGHPEQYFYNNAFRVKLTLMAIAGLNVLAFYGTDAFAQLKALPAGASAPPRLRLIAGVSLAAWIGVLICGRLITFYRPPFFH
jgi:hypothetical protein